jgi:hypothetical protein
MFREINSNGQLIVGTMDTLKKLGEMFGFFGLFVFAMIGFLGFVINGNKSGIIVFLACAAAIVYSLRTEAISVVFDKQGFTVRRFFFRNVQYSYGDVLSQDTVSWRGRRTHFIYLPLKDGLNKLKLSQEVYHIFEIKEFLEIMKSINNESEDSSPPLA